jgi:PAS domain S-box-containing protein
MPPMPGVLQTSPVHCLFTALAQQNGLMALPSGPEDLWPSLGAGEPAEAEAAELLRALFLVLEDAVIICDAAGRVTAWNPAAERLSGYPAERLGGSEAAALFSKHSRPEVEGAFQRAARGDEVRRLEVEAVRADGLPMPASVSMRRVRPAGKGPLAVLVVVRDITEQVLAQGALAETEERARANEALTHTGSWSWDVEADVVQWSEELHRIHGVDWLSFGGTIEDFMDLVAAADRDRIRNGLEAAVATLSPFEGTYRVALPSGETRTVLLRAEPVVGSGGKAIGLRGVGQDITRRSA